MYPFIDHFLPDDFPKGILTFINTVILVHCLVLVFYILGLTKDLVLGAPKPQHAKKNE